MRDGGVGVAPEDFAELGRGAVQVGLLQVREAGVDARHVIGRVGGQDLLELGEALVGTSAVDEDEAQIVAGVEVAGRERDCAAVGFDGGRGVAGALAREPELVPGFRGLRIDARWRR